MKYFLSLLFILIVCSGLRAQTEKKPFLAVFYNVENLFDTVDDKTVNDDEFLPSSEKKWNRNDPDLNTVGIMEVYY